MSRSSVWVSVLIALGFLVCVSGMALYGRSKPIYVGFTADLYGAGNQFAREMRNGIQLAISMANASDGIGGRPVELIYRSCSNKPGSTLEAYETLEKSGVEGIVGPILSSNAIELLDVAMTGRTILVSPTAVTKRIRGVRDNLFTMSPDSGTISHLLAKYMASHRQHRRVVLIYDSDNPELFRDWDHNFTKALSLHGGKIIEKIPFSVDKAKNLKKIPQLGADSIFLLANPRDTALIAKLLQKQNTILPLYAIGWSYSDELVRLGGKSVEGLVWASGIRLDDNSPDYLAFRTSYEEMFGAKPGIAGIYGYEATQVLLAALSSPEPVSLQERLQMLRYHGLMQDIVFNDTGDYPTEVYLQTIRDSKVVTLEAGDE